jgi:hypothetical protein
MMTRSQKNTAAAAAATIITKNGISIKNNDIKSDTSNTIIYPTLFDRWSLPL